MGKPPATQRKRLGKKPKGTSKDRQPLKWTVKRIKTRIARDQAKVVEFESIMNAKTPARTSSRKRAREEEPVAEPETKKVARSKQDEADQRYTIRYFYRRLQSPPEEDWDGYCGTVSEIRRLITPTQLSHSLRLTWRQHPTSERIVEDICRLPTAIDATIERQGCQVPEEAIHKKGCSRTKRKGRSDGGFGGLSSAVSKVARQRTGELRAMAARASGQSE